MTSGKDLMWTVTDNESGIAIDIREGLFNDSQDVVICLKFTTFVVATTVYGFFLSLSMSCDLLKIYYLWGSNNSLDANILVLAVVVICLKFTTFVVATTVCVDDASSRICCDLLKIYYLCGSNNSI